MNTEKEKTSSEEQKKAEKVLKDKVPVQQTGTYSEATKKEVRDAVKELNPDMSGLDRGYQPLSSRKHQCKAASFPYL